MKLTETRGKLFIIGGAEDKTGDCVILKEFVRFAGDEQAKIVVMTAATDHPEESAKEMIEVLEHLGRKMFKRWMFRLEWTQKTKKALKRLKKRRRFILPAATSFTLRV